MLFKRNGYNIRFSLNIVWNGTAVHFLIIVPHLQQLFRLFVYWTLDKSAALSVKAWNFQFSFDNWNGWCYEQFQYTLCAEGFGNQRFLWPAILFSYIECSVTVKAQQIKLHCILLFKTLAGWLSDYLTFLTNLLMCECLAFWSFFYQDFKAENIIPKCKPIIVHEKEYS